MARELPRWRRKELARLARRVAGQAIELHAEAVFDPIHEVRSDEEEEYVSGELRRIAKELQLAGEEE